MELIPEDMITDYSLAIISSRSNNSYETFISQVKPILADKNHQQCRTRNIEVLCHHCIWLHKLSSFARQKKPHSLVNKCFLNI